MGYELFKIPVKSHNAQAYEYPVGHLLQSEEWATLKTSPDWHPLRVALLDRDMREIVAGTQILRRTVSPIPLRVAHLAYIPKGPDLDWSDTELSHAFFAELHPFMRRHGAVALRVEPALEAGTKLGELARAHLEGMGATPVRSIQPLRTILLDIRPDEETLLAQMKEKWRYNIRLAARKGVTIRAANTQEDVEAWYRLLQTTSSRDRFGIHSLDYYVSAWKLFSASEQKRERGRLFLAAYDGQLLAGIFVVLYAGEAIYLYGASSNEQRQLMPNYLLQWEAIRWAKQKGARSYDFWGIPETDSETEEMAGVYRFKRGWGGRVVSFVGCYEFVYRPLSMALARKFI